MKLKPLGDKVVLRQILAEETTKSGIILPGQAKEKPQKTEKTCEDQAHIRPLSSANVPAQ